MVDYVLDLATGLLRAFQTSTRCTFLHFQALDKSINNVGLAHRVNLLLSFELADSFCYHECDSLVLVVGNSDLLRFLLLISGWLLSLVLCLLSSRSFCLELLKILLTKLYLRKDH